MVVHANTTECEAYVRDEVIVALDAPGLLILFPLKMQEGLCAKPRLRNRMSLKGSILSSDELMRAAAASTPEHHWQGKCQRFGVAE